MTYTQTPEEAQAIAQEIKRQIGRNSLMACGARDFFYNKENDNYRIELTFRVTIKPRTHHKVRITLTHDDLYRVELIKITRNLDIVIEFTMEGVFADMLSDLIYEITLNPDWN